ncbi:sugar transferase [Rubellimicrobium rubrum]|uniref:Sugar transferase n=1 Tax=Rubellimicrobium rubrum TaxID=2585369 RepID=A0A5C4MM43_9RHOB|nr:sugar transferase [Rubellimicrobium rubrum]TNC46865.1 sugar transferase [Rubellimicrobium rubrum]
MANILAEGGWGETGQIASGQVGSGQVGSGQIGSGRSRAGYLWVKRAGDVLGALVLLAPLGLVALLLVVLNPWFNRGGLFFVQTRMGQGGQPFQAWKFRSMTDATQVARGAFDALDRHRITPLGGLLRRTRLDELPQVLNVLQGEMSLIGPRPDFFDHARVYAEQVPGYRERHTVRPGISGLAQVEVGYVDGLDGLHAKVAADLHYVRHASLRLDLWIACRTLRVVLGAKGA